MADITPEDLSNLEQYNDSLRETINYSRQLSENIVRANGGLAGLNTDARMTRRLAGELASDIGKTINLTDKLVAGTLKHKDAVKQLNQLEAKYAKYKADSEDASQEVYKFLEQNAQNKLDAETNITAQLNEQVNALNNIRSADADIDTLNRAISDTLSQKAQTLNPAIAAQLNDQLDILKEQRKEAFNTISFNEKELKNIERTLIKEKNRVDNADKIIDAHNQLLNLYDDEIRKGKSFLEISEKQKLTVEGINQQLKDMATILAPFAAIWEFIKKIAFDVSAQAVQLQKSLVLSSDEAYVLRDGFNETAAASNDLLVTTNNLIAANTSLGKQLGFNTRFSNDMNIQFVKLTKEMGLSEEAAGGLAKFAKANNLTLKDTKNITLETSQRLSSQYGIQLDQKEVLEEIGKISGQTLAMFKANPAALAEAVAQAKLLGTNLNIVKKQSESLLNFESSISNELEAELLTGRQFNLERARAASLTGDLTTAMKELNNQGLDFNKFSNMNVIAQQKVAAMLGLSTDELSDQLLKQQYLNMSKEQVAALAGDEIAARLEALSAQDKFNAAVEKMQDLFANIVGGPLGKFADVMAGLLENSTVLYGVMTAIALVSWTKLITGLAASAVQAGLLAISTAASMSALTLGIGAIAIVGGIAMIASAMSDAQSQVAQPVGDMFSSNGKTVVSTKEGGLFELSNNDELAAAPGLSDIIGNKQTQNNNIVTQDNSAVINAITELNNTMKSVQSGVGQLYDKQSIINLDSQKFGTAQVIGNYNFA
jgi:hypothetical protein